MSHITAGTTSRKIQVMHVINFLYDGGTETYIHTLVSRMDSQRYDFSICCLVAAGFGAQRFIDAGIPVHVLGIKRGGGIRGKLHNLFELFRLALLMKKHRVDIVHTHDNFPSSYARIAALFARVPIVYVTYHNLYYWLSPLSHFFNRMLSGMTTRVVAVSHAAMDYSMLKDKIPAEKYRVIYNGIDCVTVSDTDKAALRKQYRDEFAIAEDAQVIGNVATLSIRKGQAALVQAFAKIAEKYPRAVLVIVGSEREDEPQIKSQLESIAVEHNLSSRLIFTGSRNDVLDMLYMCDVFTLPSETEGFGYALVEAMCAGVPSVVSDIPALSEVACDGMSALLFAPGDSDDLASKLDYALSQPVVMQALAELARGHVAKLFSKQGMVANYEDMYNKDVELLPGQRGRQAPSKDE